MIGAEKQRVSCETHEALQRFAEMVRKWNPTINLVSKASLDGLMDRHVADSLQLLAYAPPGWSHWVDIGSGGGFPGLVVGIASQNLGVGRLTLVESDSRKAVFLREVVREFNLRADVIDSRIESISSLGADVISARALAPLSALCGFASQHACSGAVSIFPKGSNHAAEIEAARNEWSFAIEIAQSKTDENGRILILRDIHHV